MSRKITSEEFVKAYMTVYKEEGNVADLAKNIGTALTTVYARIKSLTKHGVILPPLAGYEAYSPARVAKLNKLVKENSGE